MENAKAIAILPWICLVVTTMIYEQLTNTTGEANSNPYTSKPQIGIGFGNRTFYFTTKTFTKSVSLFMITFSIIFCLLMVNMKITPLIFMARKRVKLEEPVEDLACRGLTISYYFVVYKGKQHLWGTKEKSCTGLLSQEFSFHDTEVAITVASLKTAHNGTKPVYQDFCSKTVEGRVGW
jgi:hypothetical protein